MRGRPLSLVFLLAGSLLAAPRGDVTVKATGTRYENVEYEIKDERVHVKTQFGPATFARGDVIVVPREGGSEDEGEEAAAGEGGVVPVAPHVDLRGRCLLEPGPDWTVVAGASPLVRVQLKHTTRDAQVLLALRPCGKDDFSFNTRSNEELNAIKEDLALQYSRSSVAKAVPVDRWGSQVYRIEAKVTEYGDNQPEKSLIEHRFRRHELEYTVSLLVGKADQGALLPRADEILGVFSFLPPVSEQEGSLVDFTRGFALARPGPDWALQVQPFDEEVPARLLFDGGRGEVWVSLVKGKKDAYTAVEEMMSARQRSGGGIRAQDLGDAVRDGVEVRTFAFEGYRTGKNVTNVFSGFAALIGEQTILVTGVAPITDADSKKIKEDVDRALAGVRLLDPKGLAADVQQAKNALSLVSQGYAAHQKKLYAEAIDDLTKAIDLVPTYAQAHYLRALAKKGATDFEGFRADLEKAAQLDPSAGYDGELGPSYVVEGDDWLRKKEYARAADAYHKAYRAKDEKAVAKWIGALRSLYGDVYVKNKQVDKGLSDLQKRVRDMLSRPDVLDFWGKTLRDGISALTRAKEYGDARRWCNALKNLRGDPKARTDAENLRKAISDAEARGKKS